MKPMLFALLLATVFIACSKSNKEDRLPNAVQALIDSSNCTCEPYIKEYRWRSQTVYQQGYTGPTCNWFPIYFDAKGQQVEMAADYDLYDFLGEAAFVKLIWECKK